MRMRKIRLDGRWGAAEHLKFMPTAALSTVQTFEQTRDGIFLLAGLTPSQPGLLPVTGVIQ